MAKFIIIIFATLLRLKHFDKVYRLDCFTAAVNGDLRCDKSQSVISGD